MALFGRSIYGQDPTFTNLFRMLDDFENYSREVAGTTTRHGRNSRNRVVTPRFDVRETESAYELHGELPGVDRKDISIEFTDPQTMVIRGHVERTYSSGTPPTDAVEAAPATGEVSGSNDHHATVSDEETEAAKEKGESTVTEAPKKSEEVSKPKEHYWHQERSIGEFHRTFNFPSRVNDAEVTANLTDGILSVSVPKAAKHESRRININ